MADGPDQAAAVDGDTLQQAGDGGGRYSHGAPAAAIPVFDEGVPEV